MTICLPTSTFLWSKFWLCSNQTQFLVKNKQAFPVFHLYLCHLKRFVDIVFKTNRNIHCYDVLILNKLWTFISFRTPTIWCNLKSSLDSIKHIPCCKTTCPTDYSPVWILCVCLCVLIHYIFHVFNFLNETNHDQITIEFIRLILSPWWPPEVDFWPNYPRFLMILLMVLESIFSWNCCR